MNLLETETCPKCGAKVRPVEIRLRKDKTLTYRPACRCQVEEYEQQEDERRKKEERARIERIFQNSGLGPRHRGCTLGGFAPRPGTESALRAAKEYTVRLAENLKAGNGLLLFGPPGNGKSHLAAAIFMQAVNQGCNAIFERVPRLLMKIRATYSDGSRINESEIMHALISTDLLVLDDAGAEKWTQWTEPTLYTIIDERYSYEKALIITTNSSLEGLTEKIGDRAMDRVLEMCQIVENTGTSYRKEKARGRKWGGAKHE